ncbi:hypothetical protein H6G17_11110 [Chroococcidiopsis sp. FACHB-1243]|uniref:DUF6887 family protein n=1 Tax=Chroococcidiopsis sp. [FACHB-1243] TaxID=2692781 RepID=UPI0017851E01|nr:hypothetical protein [Chroococcidiopsis sp. [FACHB-1243]]MBD2306062.1 hypothetical protein [Chroococcidiopsis sp. [FACHB-1243]]
MTQPNFEAMSRKELRAYILEHREDEQAFRVYMDRITAEPPTEVYPAPKSIDDLKHFPQLLEKHRQQQKDNSDK